MIKASNCSIKCEYSAFDNYLIEARNKTSQLTSYVMDLMRDKNPMIRKQAAGTLQAVADLEAANRQKQELLRKQQDKSIIIIFLRVVLELILLLSVVKFFHFY